MNRKLHLTFFLLFSYVIVAQETYVPDDNFENYLETHDADGNVVSVGEATSMGNGVANDDHVTTSRIENVTDLDISRLLIADATGLEDFAALQNFTCFENSITSIDLSKNTALQTINVGKNSLTSLDLSGNLMLTSLSCSRNEITTLNVSQNTMLETLGCSNNQLSSLDVTNNTALKNLYCYSNPLGSLDVTQNPLLEDLDCVDTQLTVLDVSQNPELQELQAYENSLTSLDLSKNVKLVELFIEDNQITSLDVSKNVELVDLSCAYNQLTYLNIRNGNNTNLDDRDFDIRNNPGLTCVVVDDPVYANTNLTDKDAQTVYNTFCSQTYVPDDNFEAYLETHNEFGLVVPVGDLTSMGNGIANDDYVGTERIQNDETLGIHGQGITDFTGLENFASLKTLYIHDNTVSSIDLTANTNLIEVSCASMGLTSLNLSGLTSLEIVRARENNLSTIDLSSNTALHSLYLDKNDFTTIDISANTALSDFRIRENTVIDLDITNNINLTRLYCGDNSLSNLDVTNNALLETLSIGGNQFVTIDISSLSNLADFSIEDTPTLTSLDVSQNSNLEDIEVNNNTSLTTLDLSSLTKLIELYTYGSQIAKLDVSNSPDIEYIECYDGQLTSLNLKNGNNSNDIELYATGNPNLVCIQVDAPTASYLSSWEKDATASYSDDCNWTYVPDDNFENFLETHTADNSFVIVGDPTSMGNGIANDNYVKTANIENVINLFVQFQGITDFTGIEDFSALETFFCFNNLINTSLDLTNNTNLKRVDGGDMGLTSINVTGLTALERLDIPRNDFTTIDVSTNTALKTLVLSSNDLSGLDVSNNVLLEDLQIHETTLSSIDVSNNTQLKRLFVSFNSFTNLNLENNILLEDLNLAKNPFTSFDVSHLTKLEDLNLDETNIASIDISKNTNLVEFSARNMDELVELNAKNGNNSNFTEFEVDGCPNLTCIEVDDPTAGYLTGWSKDATANFAKYCRFTYVPDDNFENYLETHRENTGSVPFGDDRSLGNGVMDDYVPTEKIENLTILFIENQDISDFTGLEEFTGLERFRAYGNPVNGALDLTPNVNLNQVFCWEMGLTSINLTGLTNLFQLAVQDNGIMSLDLTTNTIVEDINIENNNLSSLDLSQNTEVTGLNYINNNIQTIDLSQNTKLVTLKCSENTISTIDVQNNTAIETLEIANNPMVSINVSNQPELVNLIINNTNISEIDLSNNPDISQLVCNDTAITELDLSNNANMYTLEVHNNAITELNLGNLTRLNTFNGSNNQLTELNLRNGRNEDMASVDVTGNPDLTCIEVDDPTAPELAAWLKDNTANYAEYCRLTYVPNDNFEALLEGRALGNGIPNDDYVYTGLIDSEIALIIQDKDISDLTGIEDFQSLELLLCRRSNVETIDISNNTKLTHLNLVDNSLTSIDLSNNVLLEELYISDNENLESIDVSSLPLLTTLSASNTGMNTVDISNNPVLRVLNIDDNSFTTLDLSPYPSVVQLRITNNPLTSLKVANGNNTNFTWFDARGNPDLTCIEVDDINPNSSLWYKDATANYALYCDLTYVPDDNFENYLETHDADGNVVAIGDTASMGNGIANDDQVATSKIENVIILTIESQDIADLTGIETFTALESLNCDYNDLTTLDLSSNTSLKILDAAENDFITLDLSGYLILEEVNLRSNSITNLLVDNNPNLKKLKVGKNALTTLDVTACTQLEELAVHQNLLESLDVRNGNNNLITDFFVLYNPNLTCIQVDDPTATYLSSWEKDDIASFSEDCVTPVITLLGDNPQVIELGSGYTELGATVDDGVTNVVIDTSDFRDAVGSYTIRYNATDASGNVAIEVTRTVNVINSCPIVSLPANNFTITTTSETCTDKDNGTIAISAVTVLDYNTTINGVEYSFTSALTVDNLPPGTYPVCIAIEGFASCEQCFEMVIEEAESLTGKTELLAEAGTAKVNVEVTTGTAPYIAKINNKIVGEYTTKNFILDVQHGDELEVSSSVDCEGKLSTKVSLFDQVSIAPNPTKGDVTLTLPDTQLQTINVSMYNALGTQVSSGEYIITSGQVILPMKQLPQGIYFVSIDHRTTFKIVKQ
ncbi:Leucine-rich repeat (LRR) protein [Aquimarina sp. EL_43]|uniref:immunoglobulin-like domain-containing protein n=1 Tax=unclassified Aquimarina TaxID=2627091 RepID=UPI0018C90CD7|nr:MULTISPECIES: immunoglobulin-like domain-containing protein [unclassified Aquimarina]MBG6132726.1 Leucine-rich repeat (LRR) protein [Aquimarina sp. EL_35]MBG6153197.1 Leucine-rich repeat (LRR) protein [Aquimarina sp. EL_32]MBG6171353.1 Leucine-rich repeat (LRR) protein [Aquimarina sp. EL_43]